MIITSRQVTKDYLEYLDGQNISWIVSGDDHIDLAAAVQVLADQFHVKRIGIVGGPTINTAFLEKGLLDEVDILIGSGIDGRAEMPSVKEAEPLSLKLTDVKKYDSGVVLLQYKV